MLQIASICEVYELDGTDARIRDYLNKIPRSLTEIYEQALKRIPEITGDDCGVTRRIFKCIAYARQPLTLAELEEAINIKPGQKMWERPKVVLTGPEGLSRLSKRSSNLVRFNELDKTITLSHHSVRMFLQSCAKSKIPEISQFLANPSVQISFGGKFASHTSTSLTLRNPSREPVTHDMQQALVNPRSWCPTLSKKVAKVLLAC